MPRLLFSLQPIATVLVLSATLAATQTTAGKSLQFQPFDESYVQRLRDGDFRTQQHFYNYFGELMQLKLRSKVDSQDAIDDIKQETFLRVLALINAGKVRQPDRLGACVNAVCNNVLREYYRRRGRDVPMSGDGEGDDEFEIPSNDKTPEDKAITNQDRKRVQKVLQQMPERDGRILEAMFMLERDRDEICSDYGVDREYLRVLFFRAKKAFKDLYLQ